ncbi:MAG TPA: hypothetical protein QKA14_02040 [Candidatus Megaira endosymbiont of Hartmannula sinica]|nr:hypothetical protein [Candidatus Megaera endosymbiont of Hartmannula sinica]
MLENYQLIIEEINKLLNASSVMISHADKFSNMLIKTTMQYDKFAASFNSNFISKIKNINKLALGGKDKSINNMSLSRYHISQTNDLIEIEETNNNITEEKD